MQLSSLILYSSTLFASAAFAIIVPNPIGVPNPIVPDPKASTTVSFKCSENDSACLRIGVINNVIRSVEGRPKWKKWDRSEQGDGLFELSFVTDPPCDEYRIQTDTYGQLVYGDQGTIVYFREDDGLQHVSLFVGTPDSDPTPRTFENSKLFTWCGTGTDGSSKDFFIVKAGDKLKDGCEIIYLEQDSDS